MPAGAGGISTTGPPPGMQAETSYTNAYRDYGAGNYDLALQELKDYVRYFPQTQLAPNAQYYIGDIYYRRKDYDNAITAFDAVLEHFSDNNKTPDAHLMKGRSLLAENKRDAAAREFKEIIAKYPDSDAAAKAKSLLKELGLSSSSAKKKHR
jgi:tol-pal system protein YbgF